MWKSMEGVYGEYGGRTGGVWGVEMQYIKDLYQDQPHLKTGTKKRARKTKKRARSLYSADYESVLASKIIQWMSVEHLFTS